MTEGDPLALETRRRLWEQIEANPGLHLRELQRRTGLAMGSLEHHLDRLHDARLVTVVENGHKRFFPVVVPAEDRRVLAFLRQELPRRMLVVALAAGAPVAKSRLLTELGSARSTLEYHLGGLVASQLVETSREGRETRISLRDPARVERLLLTYRASFLDRMVDSFVAAMDAMRLGGP